MHMHCLGRCDINLVHANIPIVGRKQAFDHITNSIVVIALGYDITHTHTHAYLYL